MILRERSGDTLTGVVDGVNTVFVTTFPFVFGTVFVYLNGRLKDPVLDDGFIVTFPNTVTLKQAPLAGPSGPDTVEVEYRPDSSVVTGGGAEGGCPEPPEAILLEPELSTLELVPQIIGGD